MRIFVAGATGVLGRATLPHLAGHELTGTTRTPAKLRALEAQGVTAVLLDATDAGPVIRVVSEARPEIVVNFLTDLASGDREANSRVRRLGGRNLVAAAQAAGAWRLVVESVAFALTGEGGRAAAELERTALEAPLETLILRFGRFWGPGTLYEETPQPPAIHVEEAGARAARLIVSGSPGIHLVAAVEVAG